MACSKTYRPRFSFGALQMELYKAAGTVGWGASLYPSGYFTLWRKSGTTTLGFKEAFVSVGQGIFRGRPLDKVQEVYGPETVHQWWNSAKEVDMSGVRPRSAPAVEAVVTLGSSTPVNSRKRRRGMGGLSSRGKNLVRESAIALEKQYGKNNLTFWTVTLPSLTEEDYRNVCEHWSEICKSLKEKVLYRLREAGLPPHVVGVTEMQEQRWNSLRVPAWHLHLVFVGYRSSGGWVLTPKDADRMWRGTVGKWCTSQYSWKSASKLERVKKSVGAYLSKYLSKGTSVISEVDEKWPGCIPPTWYICTKLVRSWVALSTRKGDAIASWLYQMVQDSAADIKGLWAYCIETRPGQPLAVCWMGTIPDPPRTQETLASYVRRMT